MLNFGFRYLYGDISRTVGRFLQFHVRTATSVQEATQSSSEQHVAVLAFRFGSHGLTIFNLMLKLASAAPNLKFSFFSTKKSNDSLLSASKSRLPDNIKVYDIEDGVPMKNASTESNRLEAVELLQKATPENFKKGLNAAVFETGRKISCMLTDAFLTFSGEMARDMHIPWLPVFVAMPYNVSAHIHTGLIHQFFINSSGSLRLEDQTLDIIPGLSMMRISDLSDEILWGDSRESLFSSMLSKLGGVLPQAIVATSVATIDSDETACNGWTDKRQNLLRIISFGTVAIPPEDELIALAEAIGESDVPFLWSLQDDKICVFVTHCGANSVCESIANGVLMICRPFFGDHRMNARLVEEVWGIGVKVEGIVLTKSGVLQSLELMFSHEGKKMRENVRHLKEIVIEAGGPKP
ncbi:Flavonol 3-O-glucosyltransferase [Citrus sinensis]|nr:Flavonol 3-O-glucosyltransferase [Citrus sinensis]